MYNTSYILSKAAVKAWKNRKQKKQANIIDISKLQNIIFELEQGVQFDYKLCALDFIYTLLIEGNFEECKNLDFFKDKYLNRIENISTYKKQVTYRAKIEIIKQLQKQTAKMMPESARVTMVY